MAPLMADQRRRVTSTTASCSATSRSRTVLRTAHRRSIVLDMESAHAQTVRRFVAATAIVVVAALLLGLIDRFVPHGVGQSDAFAIVVLIGLVGSWFAGFQLIRGTPPASGLLRAVLLVAYIAIVSLSLAVPLLYSCLYLGDCL